MQTTRRRVLVVGGGPAGLMAAGQAARQGAKTLLIEKMDRPGRKLAITGKGRCNLTNMVVLPEFLGHFRPDGRVLRQVFSMFFSPDLVAFLNDLGVATAEERGGRVFPASGRAPDVVAGLVAWLEDLQVELRTGWRVSRVLVEGGRVAGVEAIRREAGRVSARRSFRADAVVMATGGATYRATGSTGDGYGLSAATGHAIVPIRPALISLVTAGDIAPRCQGVALRNVRAKAYGDRSKLAEAFGEMLLTDYGLSGPIILCFSGQVVDAMRSGRQVSVAIDLKPALDEQRLDARLQRDFGQHGREPYWMLLRRLLPRRLIPVCVDATGVPAETPGSHIRAVDRRRLRKWIKDFRFRVRGHRPLDEAIVTAGGVAMRDIDPRTMASRKIAGLYFAGELLDIDADTGGYNLQAAFSTGWVAGRSAAG